MNYKHLSAMLIVAAMLGMLLPIIPVAAGPVVDGVISPGEYAGGMAVTLVGPYPAAAPFPPQTVDAYIEWDSQYLYVAVNEPVPTLGGGTNDWIEFAFDAGPHRPFLDAFVLFGSGQLQYVKCPKPPGGWGWDTWPHTWWAVTGAATEFKFDYTDFGITFGDTIKMVIDRGRDAGSYPPLGDCVTWPFTAKYYPPQGIDPTTWGDVGLNGAPPPPPPTHVVDGVIGSVEYAGGMAVLLVGRTDPSWTVDAYIDWDSQYLYVAVNEPVPPGGTGLDWIEFAFDAGLGRPFLDAFVLFGTGAKTHVQCPKPPGSWATTPWPYTWWAATGAATEFKFDYTDFGITIGDTIKMSIDRNDGPSPPAPYGFAAFWPSSAQVYSPGPPDPTTWGDVYLAPPPLSVSLTVVSAYDAPNPSGTTSYTPGTSVTASVTSPVAGPAGYRYVCTGWTGTGDVPGSGTGTTVTFTINQDSGLTWNWKTQTYLTVKTDPPGIVTIPGEGWYDLLAYVTLTAPAVPGYVFSYWDFNGVSQGSGVNPITVQVKCVATAHYDCTIQYTPGYWKHNVRVYVEGRGSYAADIDGVKESDASMEAYEAWIHANIYSGFTLECANVVFWLRGRGVQPMRQVLADWFNFAKGAL